MAERGLPCLEAEDEAEVFRLLMKWDSQNLLELHSVRVVPPGHEGKVKIFNAHKSSRQDRQIGDRRWRNAFEGRILGPITDLLPSGHGVRACVTGRSDFYHQLACTLENVKPDLASF